MESATVAGETAPTALSLSINYERIEQTSAAGGAAVCYDRPSNAICAP